MIADQAARIWDEPRMPLSVFGETMNHCAAIELVRLPAIVRAQRSATAAPVEEVDANGTNSDLVLAIAGMTPDIEFLAVRRKLTGSAPHERTTLKNYILR